MLHVRWNAWLGLALMFSVCGESPQGPFDAGRGMDTAIAEEVTTPHDSDRMSDTEGPEDTTPPADDKALSWEEGATS